MERSAIALVSDWYPPRIGGVERQVEGLARALAGAGHDVHVVTTTRGTSLAGPVKIHRVDVPMLPRVDVAAPNLWRVALLRQLFRREGIQLVHAHGMFSTAAIGSVLAAHQIGVPSVLTVHSLIRGYARSFGARLVFGIWSRRADVVAACSQAAADDVRRVTSREVVPVLPNGIDPREWPMTARDGTSNTVRVASIMRLTRKRAAHVLVEAVPQVLAATRDVAEVRFCIAGDGPERRSLESRAAELGVGSAVEFLGALPLADVRATLGESDLVASPGAEEAFGVSLLEARSAGVPVVAMNQGGVREIICHGEHGLLADTPAEFVDHLVRLIRDQPLRAGLAYNARCGLDRYAWPSVVATHLEVYRMAREFRSAAGGVRSRTLQ